MWVKLKLYIGTLDLSLIFFFILQRTGFEVKVLNLNLKQRSIFLDCSLNF